MIKWLDRTITTSGREGLKCQVMRSETRLTCRFRLRDSPNQCIVGCTELDLGWTWMDLSRYSEGRER